MKHPFARWLAVTLVAGAAPSFAFELPAVCTEKPFVDLPTPGADTAPLPQLKAEVEKLIETDANASVALLCKVIPRVERERGAQSIDMAWWVGSLGTPLIAYMDRLAEAVPLLEYARPIYAKRLGRNAAEIAEIYVAYAWIATRQGRNADAAAAWRNALAIREKNPGPRKIELQKVLVGLAQNVSFLREFDVAKQMLARAEVILAENRETVSEAAAAIENTYVNIAWREEDYAAVRAHAQKQIGIEAQLPAAATPRVPAYIWLGQGLERLDEFEAAEAALRQALEIAENRSGQPMQRHQIGALSQLSGLLLTRGRAAEAADLAIDAIGLIEATRGKDAPLLVRPLQYLASAELALGDLPASLRHFERAQALIDAHPGDIERPWIVAHYRGLARLQLSLGEREQALASLNAGVTAAGDDSKLLTERAATLLALGALSTADPGAGRATVREALTLYRTRLPDSHPAILRAITEACALEIAGEDPRAASCEEAAQRVERASAGDPFLRHDIHALGGALAAKRGDTELAYALAIRALSAANTLGTPDPLWRADFTLAQRLEQRADTPLAIYFGKESIAQIERLRGRFTGDERRLERAFLADKVSVYRTVADWLMAAGRIDEGLDVLRLLKDEELYDFVMRDARWSRQAGIELTPDETALRERYRQLLNADANAGSEIDRLGRLGESGKLSASERVTFDNLVAGQQQRESARADRIKGFLSAGVRAPAAAPGRAIQAETLANELKTLPPDTALAFYLLTESRLRVFVATRRGQFEYESAIDAAALRRQIGAFLDGMSRRENVAAASRALYAAIAQPVDEEARRAGAKRLVLWLDGALRYVPFAALSDGSNYLVDRYSIESYSPRAAGAARSARAGLTVRGLGLTQAVPGFDALPAMADELCGVVRGPIEGLSARGENCPRDSEGDGALSGAGFADAAFTAERLTGLLGAEREFSVLHLGTHFSLRPGNARRSFLVLGDGSRMSLDAIAALDFHDLKLVTLSACQSALGGARTDDGREIEGLSAIVQRRGAESVVASLWRVEDRSTAQLMRGLYDNLPSQKGDAAGALRRAQLELRALRVNGTKPYEHPYYWGGFLVSGS